MNPDESDTQRFERYHRVLTALVQYAEFPSAKVRLLCAEEKPAFVTRVVRELTKDGLLGSSGEGKLAVYAWRCDRAEFSLKQWIESKVYNDRLTRAPVEDRPRERLLALGADELRTAELVAILIRTGRAGESALQAGEKVAARFAADLDRLRDAGRGELRDISPVIADTAYCQIMAGIELGRRVVEAATVRAQHPVVIRGSGEAVELCRARFARLAEDGAQEEFHIITLNTKNQVISGHLITIGLLDQCMIHPREVFRPAIKDAAKSIILVHNHPSGDPTPSDKDRQLTERLESAGQLLGIQVLDHIVVARHGVVSLQELAP